MTDETTPASETTAVVVPLPTATLESAPERPSSGEVVPFAEPPAAPAEVAAVEPVTVAPATVAISPLVLRLQRLTTHTLPIAWYRITRVGPAGLVGAAAMLVATLVGALALVAGRQATDALTTQIAHVQAQPGLAASGDGGVSKIVATLPRRREIPALVGLVMEQARAANVVLDNGHYSYTPPKGASTVGRYELDFPVKATYPNVRDFIDRTLSAVPAAGLGKVRIERKVVGDPVVSADIRFVVFVRPEP
jgi:hypothetical protein